MIVLSVSYSSNYMITYTLPICIMIYRCNYRCFPNKNVILTPPLLLMFTIVKLSWRSWELKLYVLQLNDYINLYKRFKLQNSADQFDQFWLLLLLCSLFLLHLTVHVSLYVEAIFRAVTGYKFFSFYKS